METRNLSIDNITSQAWGLTKKHLLTFLVLTILMQIIAYIPNVIQYGEYLQIVLTSGDPALIEQMILEPASPAMQLKSSIATLICLIIAIYPTIVIYRLANDAARGEQPDLAGRLKDGLRGYWFFFGCSIVYGVMVCMMILLKMLVHLKGNYDALMESYRNLEELNSTLRAQRHDYLNHLQVVYGMMELNEYEELHNYLEPVYKDMLKTGKALRTSKPAINALLKAKMGEAERKHIDVYVEVKSDLKELRVADWEICKVLSNLIDNAMTALEAGDYEKKIEIDITETKEEYVFSISNNGPVIPIEVQEHIFKQGFTTKREEGHGMGLFIVQNVLKENAGSISLTSKEEETTFVVKFRKEVR